MSNRVDLTRKRGDFEAFSPSMHLDTGTDLRLMECSHRDSIGARILDTQDRRVESRESSYTRCANILTFY
jgi:hypothetical protein